MAVIYTPEQIRNGQYPQHTDGSDQYDAMMVAAEMLRNAMRFDSSEDGRGDTVGDGPKGFQFYGSIGLPETVTGATDVELPTRQSDVDLLVFNGPDTNHRVIGAIVSAVQHTYGVRFGVTEVNLADVKDGKRPDPFFASHIRRGYARQTMVDRSICVMPRLLGQRKASGIEDYYDDSNFTFNRGSSFLTAYLRHKCQELSYIPTKSYAGMEMGLNLPKSIGRKVFALSELAVPLLGEYSPQDDSTNYKSEVARILAEVCFYGESERHTYQRRLVAISETLGVRDISGLVEHLGVIATGYSALLEQTIEVRAEAHEGKQLDLIVANYTSWLNGNRGQVYSLGQELARSSQVVVKVLREEVMLAGKDLAIDDARKDYPEEWLTTDSGGTLEFDDIGKWLKYVDELRKKDPKALCVDPANGIYAVYIK